MDTDIGTIFYMWVTLVSDLNQDRYETDIFFYPTGTTAIILGCEQVKMYLFYYINYDLFIVEFCYSVISNIY
jgi:hypothetical protein